MSKQSHPKGRAPQQLGLTPRPVNVGQAQSSIAWNPITDKRKYKSEYDLQVNTLTPGDKLVPRVLGITFMSDGRLVTIDNKNKCIKVFKPNWYEDAFRYDLDDEPRGLVAISSDDIVVTFAYKLEVQRFKIGKENNIIPDKAFKVKEKPFSISFSKNTLAIETGEGKDGSIIITDTDGKQLHKISGNRRHFGMFTGNTIRLAHDHDTKCMYVVDIPREWINCVDYTGDIRWTIKGIKGPRDISMYEDVLFVASKTENMIFQLDRGNGKFMPLLASIDNIIQPRFLACQSSLKRLAVEVGGNVINLYMCSNI